MIYYPKKMSIYLRSQVSRLGKFRASIKIINLIKIKNQFTAEIWFLSSNAMSL